MYNYAEAIFTYTDEVNIMGTKKTTVFIDGGAGTTGLRIHERLATRDDIELLTISEEQRKDPSARLEMLIRSDVTFLCLPDDAAKEAVIAAGNADTVIIDTSTAHRTSLDTAGALAELISSGYNELNTELVDICHMRSERQKLSFIKMQATGDDYIFIENFDGALTCPESLCIQLCERHRGIGGYGIVLMEKSTVADFRLRIFNRDGSESGMAGNSIRCAAKYLFDSGIVTKTDMTAETAGGIKKLHLLTRSGKVSLVTVEMGKAIFTPEHIPVALKGNSIIDRPIEIDDGKYRINCISLGNPHCVVFADKIESIDIERIGPLFENAPIFPERTNTEFVRVVNRNILKMRVYERGNGETNACGTGACAAVAAAIENGLCSANETVTVKTRGGDLLVKYTYDNIFLTGNAEMIFTGTTEF